MHSEKINVGLLAKIAAKYLVLSSLELHVNHLLH